MPIINEIGIQSQDTICSPGDINRGLFQTIKFNNQEYKTAAIVPNMSAELIELLNSTEDSITAWDKKLAREYIQKVLAYWIEGISDWKHFITLTFTDFRYPDVAMSLFKRLLFELNKELFGKRFRPIVGHNYFSYVIGMEMQIREVVHFHVIADNQVNYKKVHAIWNNLAGYAWIDQITDKECCIDYVTKYVLKGGEVDIFKAKKNDFLPVNIPYWWSQQSTKAQ